MLNVFGPNVATVSARRNFEAKVLILAGSQKHLTEGGKGNSLPPLSMSRKATLSGRKLYVKDLI